MKAIAHVSVTVDDSIVESNVDSLAAICGIADRVGFDGHVECYRTGNTVEMIGVVDGGKEGVPAPVINVSHSTEYDSW